MRLLPEVSREFRSCLFLTILFFTTSLTLFAQSDFNVQFTMPESINRLSVCGDQLELLNKVEIKLSHVR